MPMLAQNVLHFAGLFRWGFSSTCFNSVSLDYKPSLADFRSSALLGTTSNGLASRLHFSSKTGGILRGQRQCGRAECRGWGWGVSCGGSCRNNSIRRVVFQSSSFQKLPLLQLHVPVSCLPVSKCGSCCGQASPRLSRTMLAALNCFGQSIGTLGLDGRSSQRRASRGDESGNGSEEETKGRAESVAAEENEEDRESPGELRQEVQEAQENEQNDDKKNGKVSRDAEANRNETLAQNEDFKTVLWRKILGLGQNVGDDESLTQEEELLLQDLESLRFSWRDMLDPTWENVVALGFTALLTVALVKILSQLVLVVITILLSAVKYTVLAAFLLGLLVFLL